MVDDGDREGAGPLTGTQRRRAQGAVVAAAVGDALGAPYEFQAPLLADEDVGMIGGGVLGWAPGEWTDDTAMAVVVLDAARNTPGHDLRAGTALDQIAREWCAWSIGTRDIGSLTSFVVQRAVEHAQSDERSLPQGADFRQAALDAHAELSLSAGNGALMRTHVVAIAHLHSEDDVLHEAVVAVSSLTHVHTESLDACVLWAFAVREAILTGRLDVRAGIDRLPEERAREWALRLEEAETAEPSVFARNGWAVHALQAAWSAIHGAGPLPEGKFAQRALLTDVLERAVRAGNDTDTVACIAGALMGAALGYKAVQPEWRRRVFGWPGMELADLMGLVDQVLGVPEDPGSTLASVATVTVASPPSPAAP